MHRFIVAVLLLACLGGCRYVHKGMTGRFPDDPPSGYTAEQIQAMPDDQLGYRLDHGLTWSDMRDPNVIAEVRKRGWFTEEEWVQIERGEVMLGQREKVAYYACARYRKDSGGLDTIDGYHDTCYYSTRQGYITCRGGTVVSIGSYWGGWGVGTQSRWKYVGRWCAAPFAMAAGGIIGCVILGFSFLPMLSYEEQSEVWSGSTWALSPISGPGYLLFRGAAMSAGAVMAFCYTAPSHRRGSVIVLTVLCGLWVIFVLGLTVYAKVAADAAWTLVIKAVISQLGVLGGAGVACSQILQENPAQAALDARRIADLEAERTSIAAHAERLRRSRELLRRLRTEVAQLELAPRDESIASALAEVQSELQGLVFELEDDVESDKICPTEESRSSLRDEIDEIERALESIETRRIRQLRR